MSKTRGSIDRLYAFLRCWLEVQKRLPTFTGDLNQLKSEPSAEVLTRIVDGIYKKGLSSEGSRFEKLVTGFWQEHLKLQSLVNGKSNTVENPKPLKPLFRIATPDAKSELVIPAPADADDVPFRWDEIKRVSEILQSTQLLVLSGHLTGDVSAFMVPALMETSKKLNPRYLKYTDDIQAKLDETTRDKDVKMLLLEWNAAMANDQSLARNLYWGFLKDPSRRRNNLPRLVIVNNDFTTSNHQIGKNVKQFLHMILEEEPRSVRLFGLLPKLMNDKQAAKYIFGQASGGDFGDVGFFKSYIPLMTPYLGYVREVFRSEENPDIFEVYQRAMEEMGIDPSEKAAAILFSEVGAQSMDQSVLKWNIEQGNMRVTEPYETFLIPANTSEENGEPSSGITPMGTGSNPTNTPLISALSLFGISRPVMSVKPI